MFLASGLVVACASLLGLDDVRYAPDAGPTDAASDARPGDAPSDGDPGACRAPLDCDGGPCAPPELVRAGFHVEHVAADDARVYWASSSTVPGQRGLWGCAAPCPGGAPQYDDSRVDSLALAEGVLFYGALNRVGDADVTDVRRCAVDGCQMQGLPILAGSALNQARITGVAVGREWVMALAGGTSLYQAPKGGGGPVAQVVTSEALSAATHGAGRFYVVAGAGGVSASLLECGEGSCSDAGQPRTLDTLPELRQVAAVGDRLYFTERRQLGPGHQVSSCALPGCTGRQRLADVDGDTPSALVADACGVYWASRPAGGGAHRVWGCPVAGCDRPRSIAAGLDEVRSIALSRSHVYLAAFVGDPGGGPVPPPRVGVLRVAR